MGNHVSSYSAKMGLAMIFVSHFVKIAKESLVRNNENNGLHCFRPEGYSLCWEEVWEKKMCVLFTKCEMVPYGLERMVEAWRDHEWIG